MEWIDSPPCTSLSLVRSDADVVELAGPQTGQRIASGFATAIGAMFVGAGLTFLRLPFPMPFRMIPLIHTAVGGAVGAYGILGVTGKVGVLAERRGLTVSWQSAITKARSRFIAAAEIAAFEVKPTSREVGSDHFTRYVTDYRLLLVKKDGSAVALEVFDTMAQAVLRRDDLQRVLSSKKKKPKRLKR